MKNTLKSAKSLSLSKSSQIVTLSQFRAEYQKADEFCQEVTSFIDEAGIPALNELRNAGHHFLRALDDDGKIATFDDLIAARNHARRASYEAYEAGILFALGIIAKFKDDYSTIPVEGTVADYTGLLRKANDAQKSVEQGRQNGFDRADDHSIRMEAFRELRECAETLDLAREEMNKKSDPARIARKTLWVGVIGVLVAIVGILVAIAIALWPAADFWPLNRMLKTTSSSTNAATKAGRPKESVQETKGTKPAAKE